MRDDAQEDDLRSPVVRSDVATAVLDAEVVIFDPLTSLVHQLNPVGSVVWQLLDGSATVSELVADLADGFEAPVEQVRRDVHDLLEMLAEQGLLADGGPRSIPSSPAPPAPSDPAYLVDPPAP